MFTGIIAATAEVMALESRDGSSRLTVAAPQEIVASLKTGDSIAVSGVCLTALQMDPNANPPRFSADLAAETLARTTLAHLHPGAKLNVELPTPAGAPLGGHVVQGHVDGVAILVALDPVRNGVASDWTMLVRVPDDLLRYIVAKGSIAVEGISLTVAAVEGDQVRIAILPHTYSVTNLHALHAGDGVNIEVDVLAKYAGKRLPPDRAAITTASLLADGY